MRKITTILFVSLFLFSCKEKNKQVSQAPTKPEIHKELYGSYIGSFSDYEYSGDSYATVSLNINMITEDGIQGYSIVNGNKQSFAGTMTGKDSIFTLNLKEPGDKKSDGTFQLTINGDSISGTWQPLFASSKLKMKDLNLVKKQFKYDPTAMLQEQDNLVDYTSAKDVTMRDTSENGEISTYVATLHRGTTNAVFELNGSQNILKESELKNLNKLDLEVIKNTIYARHGYAFKTKVARQFFNGEEWYMPIYDDVEKELTKTEQTNIATINRFAKYAADNYDAFGR